MTKKKFEQLQNAFKEHYWSLVLLGNYRDLNVEGFGKILKKFDKIWQTRFSEGKSQFAFELRVEMLSKLKMEQFCKSKKLSDWTQQTEVCNTSVYSTL